MRSERQKIHDCIFSKDRCALAKLGQKINNAHDDK